MLKAAAFWREAAGRIGGLDCGTRSALLPCPDVARGAEAAVFSSVEQAVGLLHQSVEALPFLRLRTEFAEYVAVAALLLARGRGASPDAAALASALFSGISGCRSSLAAADADEEAYTEHGPQVAAAAAQILAPGQQPLPLGTSSQQLLLPAQPEPSQPLSLPLLIEDAVEVVDVDAPSTPQRQSVRAETSTPSRSARAAVDFTASQDRRRREAEKVRLEAADSRRAKARNPAADGAGAH